METNLIYLLNSGNILNMFEIQKCWKKYVRKTSFEFQNTLLNIGPTLCYSIENNIFFGLFLS